LSLSLSLLLLLPLPLRLLLSLHLHLQLLALAVILSAAKDPDIVQTSKTVRPFQANTPPHDFHKAPQKTLSSPQTPQLTANKQDPRGILVSPIS
jgi:hypothetical protein